ncbi:MAG: molybdopterin-dependent oxidoreductase [Acidobacteria bacterium]|nr:molybdopterin-dependent oxidoreductase [Acidobacteriota bacterium]
MSCVNNIARRGFLLLLAVAPLLAAQQAPEKPILTVRGDLPSERTFTLEQLRAMPRASVETTEDGVAKRYEGVWLHEALAAAGAPMGDELRGKALAGYVLAVARDGYQVVFGLAEIDPVFREPGVLLADQVDGRPLFPYQGPLRLVVAGDKRGARSIRMLERLEVVRLRAE